MPDQFACVHSLLCATFATENIGRAEYASAWRKHDRGEEVGLRQSPHDACEVDAWLSDSRARIADSRTTSDNEHANHRDCE